MPSIVRGLQPDAKDRDRLINTLAAGRNRGVLDKNMESKLANLPSSSDLRRSFPLTERRVGLNPDKRSAFRALMSYPRREDNVRV